MGVKDHRSAMNAPEGEETIFAEALRLPPEERAAYFAQSTNGNAEVRQRIKSLLGSYQATATISRRTRETALRMLWAECQ
jgi:hypothetical protein